MGKFVDAVKAGAQAFVESIGPGPYAMAGKPVRCGHCQGTSFLLRNIDADEVGTFMPLAGFALVCVECTRVEVFQKAPMRVS